MTRTLCTALAQLAIALPALAQTTAAVDPSHMARPTPPPAPSSGGLLVLRMRPGSIADAMLGPIDSTLTSPDMMAPTKRIRLIRFCPDEKPCVLRAVPSIHNSGAAVDLP